MTRLISLLISVAALLGCQAEDRGGKTASLPTQPSISAPSPKIDLSTPDRALKSYWAQKDWYDQLLSDTRKDLEKSLTKLPKRSEVFAAVTMGEALAYWAYDSPLTETKLQRDIDTVKQETDSRAVALVRIKNVTPIPEGAEASPLRIKWREAGKMFRYVLEKEGQTWKVAEVWINEDSTGWRKDSGKRVPSYPSFVFHD